MLWVYRLLFIPALLVLGPGYVRRMRRRGGYREDFFHRFGAHPPLPEKNPVRPRVWLQAVSVGEMLAIGPLLEGLHGDGAETYLTTTTSTGYQLARDRYRALTVGIGYFPVDWWPFVTRAWRSISPDLLILTEGERWPEHLRQARIRGVPVICVNARLSDRSFSRMRRFPIVARLTLQGVTRFLAASADDEARLLELGISRSRVVTSGNIKLDVRIPLLTASDRAGLRAELGLPDGGLVLLGSSTWPGEEAALVAALRRARAAGLNCGLLIVPRHAERRNEIVQVLAESGLRFHLRSSGPATADVDVAVADTTGELRKLTQLADLVFIGKSLPPHSEGQTPVEAAALGKPILLGPGMSNFRPIARALVARDAAQAVASAAELAVTCEELLRDSTRRAAMAGSALRWHRENAGAVQKTLDAIREQLAKPTR